MRFIRPATQYFISLVAATLTTLLALLFIGQWIYRLHQSNMYVRSLPPMAGSVSFLFFLTGSALVALELGKKGYARAAGFFVALVSLLDFAHENLGFGIDIDQVLSFVFYQARERHFYRMAPNTAVAFLCASVAIFFLSRQKRKEFSTFIANLLGGISATFGIVSLFGYTAGVASAYTWRNFVGMAMYTAILFVFLGSAISLHALQRVSLRQRRVHTPILVALTVMAIVIQLYRVQSEQEIKTIRENTTDRAYSMLNQITDNLDDHLDDVGLPVHFEQIFKNRYSLKDYSLVVIGNHQTLYASDPSQTDPEWTKVIDFNYRGMDMQLKLTPRPHQIAKYESKLPMFLLLFGIAFAWSLGYGTYLFILTREQAIKDQDRLAWEQAISIGSDLIFVTIDQNGIVKSFNPAAERFFEYTEDEVVGRSTPMIWHDHAEAIAHAEKVSQELGRKFVPSVEAFVIRAKMGAVDRNEWTFITKSGLKKKGELSIHVLKSRRGEVVGYVGIVRDVTEQRRTEEKLVQSSKMASLGEMAGGVAHEINNPLTIIQGRATRLMQLSERSEGIPSDQLHESLKSIVETSRRIARIVKGLATFSRNAEQDEMEPAELSMILEDTLELCRERFAKNEIRLEVNDGLNAVISCRPTQISQVLLNLLNNAFDAVRNLEERWVKLDVSLPNSDWVQIRVTDSGKGISKAVSDKMMEPFFTTKEVGQGTGLGLSISKGIIDGHGGKLFLDTASGQTSFVVELKVSHDEA